ncbi:MAG: ribokinase, partial [Caldilineae bacterium]
MNEDRLCQILDAFSRLTVLVVGDFFLDKYLVIDPALEEVSLETGLAAHQVVERRTSPGAAGTVVSNLRALGVKVIALGVTGDDGNGYELARDLRARGADIAAVEQLPDWFTPTYTKPVMRGSNGAERELERLDIQNRRPLPPDAERRVIARLRELVPQAGGVAIADQVAAPHGGLITPAVRAELAALARAHPGKPFLADSRARIGLFREVMLKPNRAEARRAAGAGESAEAWGRILQRRAGRPVFVTLGAEGILVCEREGVRRVPAVPVSGPLDPVGAGDSVMAGTLAALCAGATPVEAALVGNLAASV